MDNKLIILILTILLTPSVGICAPSISGSTGTYSHGQIVIISGSAFGSKTTVAPVNFKNFEDSSITSGGWSIGFPESFTISSTNNRTNSTKYGKAFDGPSAEERVWFQRDISGSPTTIFVSFWLRLAATADQQSGKFYRLYFGPDGSHNVFLVAGGEEGTELRADSECESGLLVWTGHNLTSNGWAKVEVLATSNSAFKVWINGVESLSQTSWTYGGSCTWSPNGHSLDMPNMIDEAWRGWPADGEYGYDDIYIDYTQSRVEICNANTKSGSTHCENQIPNTTWNNTAVQVQINRGTFGATDPAYLYVIDSAGAANTSGFPITFGDSYTPSASGDANLSGSGNAGLGGPGTATIH